MATAAPEIAFKCKEDGVPATIPWIQALMDPDEPHRPYSEHGSTDKGNRQHGALTRAFPFYLPARYHRMDAREMQKMCTSPGSYWTNACHFVRILNDYGTIPYYNLRLEEPFEGQIKSCSEFCESAAEFLLETWVVIQLPFQPALLHQWAVAALAETLRYCKRIVGIGSRGYAPKFHELYTQLAEVCKTLTKNCHTLLQTFFKDFCLEPAENIHIKAEKFPFDLLAETLAALEFILSDDCTEIFNCIKRISWSKRYSPADLQLSSNYLKVNFFVGKNLYDSTMATENLEDMNPLHQHLLPHSESDKPFEPLDLNELEVLKNIVRETIFKTGSLKGMANTVNFIENLEQHISGDDLASVRRGLAMYKAVQQEYQEINEIRYQLAVLEGDVLAEYAVGNITAVIWRAAKRFDANVYLDAPDADAPLEYSIQTYQGIIQRAVAHKEEWTTENILDKAHSTYFTTANEANRQFHDFDGIQCIIEKVSIADFLADVIRSQVLRMYEMQYTTLQQGPFQFYPECMFVQYILPCFVAMMIDAQIDHDISFKTKETVLFFVSNFVTRYFKEDHVQVLCTRVRKRPFYSCFLDNGTEEKVTSVISKFQSLFSGSQNLQAIVQKLAHICDRPMNVVPKGHPNPELFMPTDSDIQISMLCCKLEKNLWKIASIRTEQRFKEHRQMTLRGLISISKFIKNYTSDMDQIVEIRNGLAACDKMKLKDRTFKFMLKDSKSLSAPQLNSIIFYEAVSSVKDADAMMSVYQGPLFPEDSVNLLTGWILSKDWWSIKRHCAPSADLDVAPTLSMSFIPLQLAKRNLCCRSLLKSLTPSKKVPMDHPGQVTFFPIQHCRWCGLVYCTEFRLCAECKDEPDYPDLNFFCSAKCDKEALDACHLEEHARFVMQKLGL